MAETLAGAPGRRGADPRVRRGGPRRALRRRGPLRPRRVRGPAPHGRLHGGEARRGPAPSCPRCAARRVARRDGPARPSGRDPGPLATSPPTTRCPTPPFWGSRVVKGIPLADYAAYLDERALFLGQWGLKSSRGDGPDYKALVEVEGRPRLRMWLDRAAHRGPARRRGGLRVLPVLVRGRRAGDPGPDGPGRGGGQAAGDGWEPVELHRLKFPRQPATGTSAWRTSSAREEAVTPRDGPTSSRFHIVTMGSPVSRGRGEAVRGQRLPRVRRAALARRPADRGAGRVLARPRPLRAGHRRARTPPTGTQLVDQAVLPGGALLLRLSGVPRRGAADGHHGPARPGADRRGALRGVPAAPGAVDFARSSSTTLRPATTTPADQPERS